MEDFTQITRSYLLKNIIIIFFVVLITASVIYQFFGLFNSLGFLFGAIIQAASFFIWTSVLPLFILGLHKSMSNKDPRGTLNNFRIAIMSIAVFITVGVSLFYVSSMLFNLSTKLFLILGTLVVYIIVLQSIYIKMLPFFHINYVLSLSENKVKKVFNPAFIYQQVLLLQMSALLRLLETLIVGIVLMIISSSFIKSNWPLSAILLGIFTILGWQGAMGVLNISRKSLQALSSVSEYPLKKMNLLKIESRFCKAVDLLSKIFILGGTSLLLIFFVSPFLNSPEFDRWNSFTAVTAFVYILLFVLVLIYFFKKFTNQLSDATSLMLLSFLRRVRINPRKNRLNLSSLSSFFEQKYLPFLIALSIFSVVIIFFIRVSTLFWGISIILQLQLISFLLMVLPVLFNITPLTKRLLTYKKDDYWQEKKQEILSGQTLTELTLEWLGYYLWVLSIFGAIFATIWKV